MRLKCLQTLPSLSPDVPFQAGQVLTLPTLTPEMRQWVADGRAIVLEDDEAAALGPAPEMAAIGSAKLRGRR
jgi:hypothetical protein